MREKIPVEPGTSVVCIKSHPDGYFKVGNIYRLGAHRVLPKYQGVRVRDEKRERKDFNFIEGSKNYFWDYFKLEGEENVKH